MNFCGRVRLGCDAAVEGGERMGSGGMVEARMGSSEEGV